MSTPTEVPRGVQKPRTYVPEVADQGELLDLAEFMRQLEAYLLQHSGRAALVDPEGNTRPLPDEVFRILDQVVNALAAGKGVTVVPQGMLLTTQQAADFLGVSRPTLVRCLEAGEIAFEKPGRHRKVRLQDLIQFQEHSRNERRAALRDLARENLDARVQVGDPADLTRLGELSEG